MITHCSFRNVLFATLLVPLAIQSSSGQEQRKLAFLVGVSKYKKDGLKDLKYAAKDVTDVAAILKDPANGFDVTLITGKDATLKNVSDKLTIFLKKTQDLAKDDVVLLYFSGHGQQAMVSIDGRKIETPFFCVYDTFYTDPKSMLSLNWIIDQLKRSGSSSNLLIVDACRNNPRKGSKSLDGSIAVKIPSKINILFSSSPGQESYESEKAEQGVFTHILLQGLNGAAKSAREEVEWLQLVSYAISEVPRSVGLLTDNPNNKQQPNQIGNITRSPVIVNKGYKESKIQAELKRRVELGKQLLVEIEDHMDSREYVDFLKSPNGRSVLNETLNFQSELAFLHAIVGNRKQSVSMLKKLALTESTKKQRLDPKVLKFTASAFQALDRRFPNNGYDDEFNAMKKSLPTIVQQTLNFEAKENSFPPRKVEEAQKDFRLKQYEKILSDAFYNDLENSNYHPFWVEYLREYAEKSEREIKQLALSQNYAVGALLSTHPQYFMNDKRFLETLSTEHKKFFDDKPSDYSPNIVLEAFLGNLTIVKRVYSPSSWDPYWVVPLIHQKKTYLLKEIFQSSKSPPSIGELFVTYQHLWESKQVPPRFLSKYFDHQPNLLEGVTYGLPDGSGIPDRGDHYYWLLGRLADHMNFRRHLEAGVAKEKKDFANGEHISSGTFGMRERLSFIHGLLHGFESRALKQPD